MRSIHFTGTAAQPIFEERNTLVPAAGPGELVIRVHAAGITPTELAWYPTTHLKSGDAREGAVPAHEFSGVVHAVGERVTGFQAGDAVYGMNDWFADGALAEYCVTRAGWIAAKPASLSHAEAATVPIGALTAWQGLFERARLREGERVLVHGGAGAVGIYAIQLARERGASVVATVSARNAEFVRSLGAGETVDYRSVPFENAVGKVDVVFDAVGGETLARSWGLLKPGGRIVTIAAGEEASHDTRVKDAFFIVEARGGDLAEIARWIDGGKLQVVVDATVGFDRAGEPFTGKLERTGRGKVAVEMVPGA